LQPTCARKVPNIIALYDAVNNMLARLDPSLPVNFSTRLPFTRDIFRILSRVSNMHRVSDNASRHRPGQRGHLISPLVELCSNAPEHAAARQGILNRLRNPTNPNAVVCPNELIRQSLYRSSRF
jgi:hypothetical protein